MVEQEDELNDEYSLGIELTAADAHVSAKRILLGQPCKTIAELDSFISEMQAELRSLTAEGHVKMAYHNLKIENKVKQNPARDSKD